MDSISVPPSMYRASILKLLYLAHDNNCLVEFLSHNKIENLKELLNDSSEKQSLLCLSAMASNDSEVLTLVSMGIDPMLDSQIVIDGCDEIGLREDYDETYDMREDTFYVCDLAIIAKQCTFETFTKVIDYMFKFDLSELVQGLIKVKLKNLDQYLRYVLQSLREKDILDVNQCYYLNLIYQEYKKDQNPKIFNTLFEYGLLSTTEIDYDFTVKDLMEKDSVIRGVYEKYLTRSIKRAN